MVPQHRSHLCIMPHLFYMAQVQNTRGDLLPALGALRALPLSAQACPHVPKPLRARQQFATEFLVFHAKRATELTSWFVLARGSPRVVAASPVGQTQTKLPRSCRHLPARSQSL